MDNKIEKLKEIVKSDLDNFQLTEYTHSVYVKFPGGSFEVANVFFEADPEVARSAFWEKVGFFNENPRQHRE